jgi:hypothetical protein
MAGNLLPPPHVLPFAALSAALAAGTMPYPPGMSYPMFAAAGNMPPPGMIQPQSQQQHLRQPVMNPTSLTSSGLHGRPQVADINTAAATGLMNGGVGPAGSPSYGTPGSAGTGSDCCMSPEG